MPLPDLSAIIRVNSVRLERCIDDALERELEHVLSGQSDHETGTIRCSTAPSLPAGTPGPVQAAVSERLLALQQAQALGGRTDYDRRRRAAKRLVQKVKSPTVPRYSSSNKYRGVRPLRVSFDAKDLPAAKGAFVSKCQKTGTREYTLEELIADGFTVVEWDGRCVSIFC